VLVHLPANLQAALDSSVDEPHPTIGVVRPGQEDAVFGSLKLAQVARELVGLEHRPGLARELVGHPVVPDAFYNLSLRKPSADGLLHSRRVFSVELSSVGSEAYEQAVTVYGVFVLQPRKGLIAGGKRDKWFHLAP
jgi:hypothetical protein